MIWGLTWLGFSSGWTTCRGCWKPAWICRLNCSAQYDKRFLRLWIGQLVQQVCYNLNTVPYLHFFFFLPYFKSFCTSFYLCFQIFNVDRSACSSRYVEEICSELCCWFVCYFHSLLKNWQLKAFLFLLQIVKKIRKRMNPNGTIWGKDFVVYVVITV